MTFRLVARKRYRWTLVIELGGLRNENLHIERLFNVLEIREFIFHNSLHKYVITGNKSKDLDPFAFRSPPAILEERWSLGSTRGGLLATEQVLVGLERSRGAVGLQSLVMRHHLRWKRPHSAVLKWRTSHLRLWFTLPVPGCLCAENSVVFWTLSQQTKTLDWVGSAQLNSDDGQPGDLRISEEKHFE